MSILIFYMYKTLEEMQSCSKVFLLDIQVPFDNCARLPITHTAANGTLFAQIRSVYTCMSVNYSLTQKDFQTYVEMCDKDILFCFRLLYPLKTCRKQQFWADLAWTFIECFRLMNRIIQFHESFPSRTE